MGGHTYIATTDTFKSEVLEAEKPVLVDFWADWCGPCKTAAPILEQISEEYSDHIKIVKIDVGEYEEVMLEYMVMTLPTFVIFQNGEPVDRIVGFQGKQKLLDKLSPYLE